MPQFDTFCFFTQLFWAFLGFFVLYLNFAFYLLPALAAVLKVRKTKLSQTSDLNANNDTIVSDSIALTNAINNFVINFSVVPLHLTTSDNASTQKLNAIVLRFGLNRNFNMDILNKLQTISFFS